MKFVKSGLNPLRRGLFALLTFLAILVGLHNPSSASASRLAGFFELSVMSVDIYVKWQDYMDQYESAFGSPGGGGTSGGKDFDLWVTDGFYATTNLAGGTTTLTIMGFDNSVVTTNNQTATIPDVVSGIGNAPLQVKAIYSYAFGRYPGANVPYPNFSSVKLGALISSIGIHSLESPLLTNITVAPSNPTFSSLDGVLFNANRTMLIRYPQGLRGSYIVPGTVTTIADDAFAGCTGLTNVAISALVTAIGTNAFGNSSVRTVYFAGNAPKHNGTAFAGTHATVYYLHGTSGWGTNFSGAPAALYNPFTYAIQNGSVTITGLGDAGWANPASPTVLIPPSINGLPVTAIGAKAFYNRTEIPSVVVPHSVTAIGSKAFENCTALRSITLSSNLVSIGTDALSFCTSLVQLALPAGVTVLPAGLLAGCSNLFDLTFSAHLTTIGDRALIGSTRLTQIAIPATVTSIGNQAFTYCSNLGFLVSPANPYWSNDSLRNLLNKAQTVLVQGNGGLRGSCFIPETVVAIDTLAFAEANLTSIYLPDSLKSIGYRAFASCNSLGAAYFYGTPPNGDTSVFAGSTNIAYYLPGVPGWGEKYGSATTKLWIQFTYVTNANSSISLSRYVGPGGNVTLPSALNGIPVTSIGADAFANNTTLTSITIPNSVTEIPANAFKGCFALTKVVLGNGLRTIGDSAFMNCTALGEINIPNNVTNIGSAAFSYTSLTNVNIGSGLTVLSDNLFANSTLHNLTIPNTVLRIGSRTFASNRRLTSVIVPGSVLSIGYQAFNECVTLANAYFQGNAPANDGTAFVGNRSFANNEGTSSDTLVNYLPETTGWGTTYGGVTASLLPLSFTQANGTITLTAYRGDRNLPIFKSINGTPVTRIADEAFRNAVGLTSLSIPPGIERIGTNAFANCPNLTNLTVAPENPNYMSVGNVLFDKSQGQLLQYAGGLGGNYTIPATVTNIAPNAFAGSRLGSVTVHAGVLAIGSNAFTACGSLTNMVVAAANPNYSSAANILYNKGKDRLIQFPGGLGGTFTPPSSVTQIASGAFSGSKLARVNIPAGVISINPRALAFCSSLTDISVDPSNPVYASANGILFNRAMNSLLQFPGGVTGTYVIPGSITTLGTSSFAGSLLSSITFPTNVVTIGAASFANCPNLTAANLFGDAPVNDGTAFSNSSRVTVTYLSGSTGWSAFYGGAPTREEPFSVASNSDNTLSITGYGGSDRVISIPATIFGQPVTAIGAYAFANKFNLLQVYVPPGITRLGTNAFVNCRSLTSIRLESSTFLEIGRGAFDGCTGLMTVFIGTAPCTIGDYAFYNCTALKDLSLGGTTVIGNYAFYGCTRLLFVYLKEGVLNVGNYAFAQSRVNQLVISATVTNIGNNAFANIGHPQSFSSIYTYGNAPANDGTAFANSYSRIFYIPGTTGWGTTYGGTVAQPIPTDFAYTITYAPTGNTAVITGLNYGFGSVEIPPTVRGVNGTPVPVVAIGDNAFAGNLSITNVIIPGTVTRIGNAAFLNCSNLVVAALPGNLSTIGDTAFKNCISLTGISIPASVVSIGSEAFANCPGVTNLNFGVGLTYIGTGAFNGCSNLDAVYFTGSAPAQVGNVFVGATRAKLYVLPGAAGWSNTFGGFAITQWTQYLYSTNSDNTITLLLYQGTDSVVTVPSAVNGKPVTAIGEHAFSMSSTLTRIVMPDTIETIGWNAFYNSVFLTNVTFGNGLRRLESGAFSGCNRLARIDLPPSLTSIGSSAFRHCALTNVILPPNLITIGNQAFYGCSLSGTLRIPPNVTFIGDSAFSGLWALYLEGDAPATTGTPFRDTDYVYTQNGYTYFGGRGMVYHMESGAGWGSTFSGLDTATWSPYAYKFVDNTVSITGYNGSGGNILVPAAIAGLPVTSIGANAFASNSTLMEITLPNSVTSVGGNAFGNNTNLAAVYFSGPAPVSNGTIFNASPRATAYYLNGATGWSSTFGGAPTASYVPFGALQVTLNPYDVGGQWRVNSGTLRNSGDTVGHLPVGYHTVSFSTVGGTWETPADRSVYVASSVTTATSVSYNWVPFDYTTNGNGTLTITRYIGYSGGVVHIPAKINGASVVALAANAFSDLSNVTSVDIPDGITSLGTGLFANCPALTSVTVGRGVTNLPAQAFSNCVALVSIAFAGNAPSMDPSAFTGANNAVIYYLSGATGWASSYGSRPSTLLPYTFFANPDATVTISSYSGTGSQLEIPSTIGGLPVSAISSEAFKGKTSLTSVVFPHTLKSVGYQAFYQCTNLRHIALSSNLVAIGFQAFASCVSLTNVVIPDGVTAIYQYAFQGNSALSNVVIGNGVTRIYDGAFSFCTNLANVALGSNLVEIGVQAFSGCSSLTNLNFPSKLTLIEASAFSSCAKVASVTFASRALTIGEGAFSGCSSVTQLRLPERVYLGSGAFMGASSLSSVHFAGPLQFDFAAMGPFADCPKATLYYKTELSGAGFLAPDSYLNNYLTAVAYTINPDETTSIDRFASRGAVALPTAIDSRPVTGLADGALAGYIANVVIGPGIRHWGRITDTNFYTLGFVADPANASFTTVDGVLFDKALTHLVAYPPLANQFQTYTVPSTVTHIADRAFERSRIGGINLPTNLVSIGNSAFKDAANLTTVTSANPDGLRTLGEASFAGCSTLTSFSTGAHLEKLPAEAFMNCVALQNIGLGSGLIEIGRAAFSNCTSLATVVLPENLLGIDSHAFKRCTSLVSVKFPELLYEIQAGAFADCVSLTSVSLHTGVSGDDYDYLELGEGAFAGCTALASVYFEGDQPLPNHGNEFAGNPSTTVYYIAGARGWTATFGGAPTATYNAFGSLVVKLTPEWLNGGWQVDNGPMQGGGDRVPHLSTGSHTVSFATVDGWLTPSNRTIGIGNLAETAISATYVISPFSYTVNPDGSATITGSYPNASTGTMMIPATINGRSVTTIAPHAFNGRASLTNLVIPDTVTSIGDSAFANCVNLEYAFLSTNLTSIDVFAFYQCSRLTTITIPDSVTSLGMSAFGGCVNLQAAIIGRGLSKIGIYESTFAGANALKAFYFTGNAPSDVGAARANHPNLQSLHYEPGTTGWDSGAFGGITPSSWWALFDYAPRADGTVIIKSLNARTRSYPIMIPAMITGLPVTELGERSFRNTLAPYHVLPRTLTTIGADAFRYCPNLVTAYIPAGVTNIGAAAYGSCIGLARITVHPSNPAYTDVDGMLYDKDRTALLQFPRNWTGGSFGMHFTIPTNVTRIGKGAFADCSMLAQVTIPLGVHSIGEGAFSGTYGITNITVASGHPTFTANNHTLISRPDRTLLHYYGRSSGSYVVPLDIARIGDAAFKWSGFASVIMYSSVTSIGAEAFIGCDSMKSILLPDSIKSLGSRAFADCELLTTVRLPSDLTNIPDGLFENCRALSSVSIPAGVTNIGLVAFRYTALSQITLPNGLTHIGDAAFARTRLTDIVIPDAVREIQYGTFDSCYYLKTAIIGAGVTNIAAEAFYRSSKLADVVFPNGLVSIGSQAFYQTPLRALTLDTNLVRIGYQAFARNNALRVAYFMGDAPETDGSAFDDTDVAIVFRPGTIGWLQFGQRESVMVTDMTSDFGYGMDEETGLITLTSYNGLGGEVTIPTEVDGQLVTRISAAAFEEFQYNGSLSITRIFIPASVKHIEDGTFSRIGATHFEVDPSNLNYASQDGSLLDGKKTTLLNAANLPQLTIGASVTNIAAGALAGVGNLTNITVDPANPSFSSHAGVLFDKQGTRLIKYPREASATVFMIPPGVQIIGESAFEGASISTILIPESVTEIEAGAFANSWSLAGIYFEGPSPIVHETAFENTMPILYYLEATGTWGATFGGINPTSWTSLFDWTTNSNNTIAITSYNEPEMHPFGYPPYVLFPKAITGLPITDLGTAFAGALISGITIPEGVTQIEPGAFTGSMLYQLSLPSTVVSIGSEAFADCNLTEIVLPAGLKSLGSGAFKDNRLETVLIPDGVTSIEPSVFEANSLSRITIPDGINSIGDYAFQYNSLVAVTLPGSLTRIGASAFKGNSIRSLHIPATVTNIGHSAFYQNALNGIILPPHIEILEERVFADNYEIESLTIPNSVTTIKASAFSGCNLRSVVVPASVTRIEQYAFEFNNLLTAYFMGNAPAGDDGTAFDYNSSRLFVYYLVGTSGWGEYYGGARTQGISPVMHSVDPDGSAILTSYLGSGDITVPAMIDGRRISTIAPGAFLLGGQITSVTLPSGITTIAANAFTGLDQLASVNIPNTVTNIDIDAFVWATGLLNITVDPANPVYSANNGVLFNKSQSVLVAFPGGRVGTYIVPDSVTVIGEDAFEGCAGLTNIVFPKGLLKIGDPAFGFCDGLTTLKFPASLQEFGDYAFAYCANLTSIYFEGDAPADNGTVFYGNARATVYYKPQALGFGTTFGSVPAVRMQGPTLPTVTVTRQSGASVEIPWSNVAAGWTDPLGLYPLRLASLRSLTTASALVSTNVAGLIYSPSREVDDQITYTVTNSYGIASSGMIRVVVNTPVPPGLSMTANGPALTFTGAANSTYMIQVSTNLTHWTTISTMSATENGVIRLTHTNAPQPAAFYRLQPAP